MWLALACAPATVQLARTNGDGVAQFGLEPGIVWVPDEAGGLRPAPTLNVAARYGVAERTDVGVRFGTAVYEVQVKQMLTSPSSTDRLALSLAGDVAVLGPDALQDGAPYRAVIPARLTVLAGRRLGPLEVAVGASVRPVFSPGAPDAAPVVVSGGGQVAVAVPLTKWLRLAPQVEAQAPLARGATGLTTAATGDAAWPLAGPWVGVQLGILVGG